ncbi:MULTISPECIES: hypothetical protein [unclassified Methylobacterium]|uniref:hypothetical protein n=1 Tax=unclassified Methylobacterium TaxID=2615210 RepID=UPI0011C1FC33|nr:MULTISPECIES: hypothetical protein [unclassified Methylobacterium]QEE40707.1 hypothetical protein FVA80_18630 [Methylobacterium sp. WL1]TXN55841.1 hypothetical protein FV241_18020 [Methylobacterium sp. WL2]
MQALDSTTYDGQAAWDRLLNPVAVEFRTAADRPSPLLNNSGKLAPQQNLSRRRAPTEGASERSDGLSATVPAADVDRVFFDPWFSRTMGILASARDPNAVDAKQRAEIVGTAEMLAAFLAEVDPSVRPQPMVDDDGNASYGTSIDGFYLNLTIDSPGKITWYAVVSDKEYFGEGAAFTGRSLPKPLREVLQLPTA